MTFQKVIKLPKVFWAALVGIVLKKYETLCFYIDYFTPTIATIRDLYLVYLVNEYIDSLREETVLIHWMQIPSTSRLKVMNWISTRQPFLFAATCTEPIACGLGWETLHYISERKGYYLCLSMLIDSCSPPWRYIHDCKLVFRQHQKSSEQLTTPVWAWSGIQTEVMLIISCENRLLRLSYLFWSLELAEKTTNKVAKHRGNDAASMCFKTFLYWS